MHDIIIIPKQADPDHWYHSLMHPSIPTYIQWFSKKIQFCDVAKTGNNHQQDDLAKFGYRPDIMKVKRNLRIIFSFGTWLEKSGDFSH